MARRIQDRSRPEPSNSFKQDMHILRMYTPTRCDITHDATGDPYTFAFAVHAYVVVTRLKSLPDDTWGIETHEGQFITNWKFIEYDFPQNLVVIKLGHPIMFSPSVLNALNLAQYLHFIQNRIT